jgi:hypothetical protein
MEKQLPETEKVQSKILDLLDNKYTITQVFHNKSTLRLKKHGANVLMKQYEYWEFDPPAKTAGNIISLMRKMTFPYYMDKKKMILFTERDAFMARMAGAQGWLDGK